MAEREDKKWEMGWRHAWRRLLIQACTELGYDDLDAAKAAWIGEREDAVAALRNGCEEFGDNDWPNDLHLADVIDKHLVRHLEAG